MSKCPERRRKFVEIFHACSREPHVRTSCLDAYLAPNFLRASSLLPQRFHFSCRPLTGLAWIDRQAIRPPSYCLPKECYCHTFAFQCPTRARCKMLVASYLFLTNL